MFDESTADKMLNTWGPKILKMIGFGDAERVVLMENLAWIVKKTGEVARRAETHEKQLATLLTEMTALRGDVSEIRADVYDLRTAPATPAKKTPGHKGAQ